MEMCIRWEFWPGLVAVDCGVPVFGPVALTLFPARGESLLEGISIGESLLGWTFDIQITTSIALASAKDPSSMLIANSSFCFQITHLRDWIMVCHE
jgi:hypothetical protein